MTIIYYICDGFYMNKLVKYMYAETGKDVSAFEYV